MKRFSPDFIINQKTLGLIYLLRPRCTGEIGNFWNQFYLKSSPEKARLDTLKFRLFNKKYKNIFLNGHKLRCPALVKKHRLEICKYFQFPNSFLRKWTFLINNFKKNYGEIIGIHMRRGDFKWAIRGDYYLSPMEYSSILKNKVKADFKNCLVIIFSEDQFLDTSLWEELKDCFSFTNMILNNGSELDDLCGLMFCDKIIGPKVSTFSRWAAFAGNKSWAGVGRKTLENKGPLDFIDCPIPWDYKL